MTLLESEEEGNRSLPMDMELRAQDQLIVWNTINYHIREMALWVPRIRTRGTKLLDDPGSGGKELRSEGLESEKPGLHSLCSFALNRSLEFATIVPPLFQKQKQPPWILKLLLLMKRGQSWYCRTEKINQNVGKFSDAYMKNWHIPSFSFGTSDGIWKSWTTLTRGTNLLPIHVHFCTLVKLSEASLHSTNQIINNR